MNLSNKKKVLMGHLKKYNCDNDTNWLDAHTALFEIRYNMPDKDFLPEVRRIMENSPRLLMINSSIEAYNAIYEQISATNKKVTKISDVKGNHHDNI